MKFQVVALISAAFSPPPEVTRVLRDWAKAQVDRDTAAIDRIEADDFTFASHQGGLFTKQQDLADLGSGDWKTVSLELADVQARLYGAGAVVTSRAIRQGRYQDRDAGGQFRWTDVFVRRAGRWRLVAHQGTRIATAVDKNASSAPPAARKPDAGQSQEQPAGSGREVILKLEEERRQAVLRGDVAALDHLLAEDFVSTTASGEVRDKRLTLSLYQAGAIKQLFDSGDDVNVRHYGGLAVVTGRTHWKESFRGEERAGQFRFTRVWVKRPGRWQLAAMHGTRIGP